MKLFGIEVQLINIGDNSEIGLFSPPTGYVNSLKELIEYYKLYPEKYVIVKNIKDK